MNTILGELGKNPKFIEILNRLEKNNRGPIEISGLNDVGMVQVGAAINELGKKPICIVTYNEIQAKKIYEDIKYFTDKVVFFPKKQIVTYDYIAESKDLPYKRIEALNEIKNRKKLIVVTTIEAIMQRIPAKKVLYKNELEFKVGEIHNLDEIKQKLVNLGYVRCDLIEGRGQFSVRGDILDISVNDRTGIRIEFWGDEIDSIRSFSISSQRSIDTKDYFTVYPAHEYILENSLENTCKKIIESSMIYNQKNLDEDIEQIKIGNYISKIDKYFNSFYDNQETILDYLDNNYCIFLDEIGKIKQRSENIIEDNQNLKNTLIEKQRKIPDVIDGILDFEKIKEILDRKQLVYIEKQDLKSHIVLEKYKFNYRDINYYKKDLQIFFENIEKLIKERKKIYILLNSKEKANKLKKILDEKSILNKFEEKLDRTIITKNSDNIITISLGKLSSGFEDYDLNQIVIVTDELVNGEKKRRTIANTAFKEGEKVVFADLKIGDYVVHQKHGIGIYIGVNTIKADGIIKDYIKIKYQNDDILYIPTSNLDTIRKYIGGDKIKPKINRLGSKDWENTKARVKKNLREVAKELIELYAKREKTEGFKFSKDTPWQSEFEGKFPYQETDDQLRCIEEVKKDMESSRPMDRLLCGDVGYRKNRSCTSCSI